MKTKATNEVQFLKQRPVHPRDRLRRIKKEIKNENKSDINEVQFLKQRPVHQRDRTRKIKKEIKSEKKSRINPKNKRKRKLTTLVPQKKITKKIKKELIDEYFDNQQQVKFLTQKPVHPRNRKIKSQPKIQVDKSAKKYLNPDLFDIKFSNIQNLSKNKRVDYIFDQLISKLPQDNNEFSIKYDPKTDTFTIYRDV